MTRLLLFAPGAGASSSSKWMRSWADRLAELGRVVPFDYAYQREGRKRPDVHAKLVSAHREALGAARRAGESVVLIGKSMGGRIGCHVALEEPVSAVVCLGYPLRSPTGSVRDEVLVRLSTPVLFVQGTRDSLCPLDLLAGVRHRMTTRNDLHVVEGGDHSLEVRKTELRSRGETQAEVDARALGAVRAFLASVG